MLKFKERIQLIKDLEGKRKEYLKKHRDTWNWIAYNTISRKRIVTKIDYLNHIGIPYYSYKCPRNQCFCCEFAKQFKNILKLYAECDNIYNCKYCPVKWDGKFSEYMTQCEDSPSEYHEYCLLVRQYEGEDLSDTKAKQIGNLAKTIANLPERKLIFWIRYAMILLGVQIVWM